MVVLCFHCFGQIELTSSLDFHRILARFPQLLYTSFYRANADRQADRYTDWLRQTVRQTAV